MTFVWTLVVFALAMAGIGLGVMLVGKPIRGSCGGLEVRDAEGELLNCGSCPVRERLGLEGGEPLTPAECRARQGG